MAGGGKTGKNKKVASKPSWAVEEELEDIRKGIALFQTLGNIRNDLGPCCDKILHLYFICTYDWNC